MDARRSRRFRSLRGWRDEPGDAQLHVPQVHGDVAFLPRMGAGERRGGAREHAAVREQQRHHSGFLEGVARLLQQVAGAVRVRAFRWGEVPLTQRVGGFRIRRRVAR